MLKLLKHTKKTNNTIKFNVLLTVLRFASTMFAQIKVEVFLLESVKSQYLKNLLRRLETAEKQMCEYVQPYLFNYR